MGVLGMVLWGGWPDMASAFSSVGTASAVEAGVEAGPILPRVLLWLCLFSVATAFHSAETAITTLWPWKVREFAEDEGEGSPFQYLANDITKVLTTILVASTICTVYGTAIITTVISQVYTSSKSVAMATAALTAFSLFFQELMPKALGVSNAELVARAMVPIIALLSIILNPIGLVFGWASKALLRLLGLKYTDSGIVTDKELRFLLEGARVSGGVQYEEAQMIEGVLDLQGTKVVEVMTPRVEMVARKEADAARPLGSN
jgi:Mg2+/Co2+ transporter CorB